MAKPRSKSYLHGLKRGVQWAKEKASPDVLRRLRKFVASKLYAPDLTCRVLANKIADKKLDLIGAPRRLYRDEVKELWSDILRDGDGKILFDENGTCVGIRFRGLDWLEGFATGAARHCTRERMHRGEAVGNEASANVPKDYNKRNAELYRRIVAGDEEAINLLAEENTLLVGCMAQKFIEQTYHKFHHLREEFFSEGCLTLVAEANRFAGKHPPIGDIRKSLTKALWTTFIRVGDESYNVGPGTSTRKAATPEKLASFPTETRIIPKELREGHGATKKCNEKDEEFKIVDARIDLESSCTSDRQRKIIGFRAVGLNDAKIAKKLGVSESTVRNDRHEVEAAVTAAGVADVA